MSLGCLGFSGLSLRVSKACVLCELHEASDKDGLSFASNSWAFHATGGFLRRGGGGGREATKVCRVLKGGFRV